MQNICSIPMMTGRTFWTVSLVAFVVTVILLFSPLVSINGVSIGSTAFGSGYGAPPYVPPYSPPPPAEPEATPVTDTTDATAPEAVVEEDLTDSISTEGEITQAVTVTSTGGDAVAEVPVGTTALDAQGEALTQITCQAVAPAAIPPATVPAGNHIVVVADFGPDGATFDPPIVVTMTYDPAALPEGDVVLAYYDDVLSEWVELSSVVVDTVNNTVSGIVSHFTQFAVIAKAEVTPEPVPVPSPPVINIPTPAPVFVPAPAPVTVPTPPGPVVVPTPPAVPTPQVVSEDFKPLASQEEESGGGSSAMWVIIGLVLAAIAIVLGSYFVMKRRGAWT